MRETERKVIGCCSTLEKLQDQAEAQPPEATRRALERELGMEVEAAFAEFEPTASAAASLAQAKLPKPQLIPSPRSLASLMRLRRALPSVPP